MGMAAARSGFSKTLREWELMELQSVYRYLERLLQELSELFPLLPAAEEEEDE